MTTTTPRTRVLPLLGLGAVTVAVMLAALVVALLVGPEGRVDPGDLVFLGVVTAAAAVVWSTVVWLAREPDAGNRAALASVLLGGLGILGCAVFWVGVPLVLGLGSAVLGRLGVARAERGAGRAALSRVGLALGVLAVVLWVLAYAFVQEW